MNKKHPVYICFIFLATSFSSCLLGPKFITPEVSEPESYLNAQDSVLRDSTDINTITEIKNDTIQLRWWEIFNDTILDTLVQKALFNNKDLLASFKRMEQARIAIGFNRADMLPTFNYGINTFNGNILNLPEAGLIQNYSLNSQISWEIDLFGKYRALTKEAQSQFFASQYNVRALQITLISDVVTNYYKLLDFKQRLIIAKETLASRDSMLSIIQSRFKNGIIPEIDLNQAEIQKAIAAQVIPVYERNIKQTQYALSLLLGELPDSIETFESILDKNLPTIAEGLPSQLLLNRPDVRQSEMELKAQNYRISWAIAQQFPNISLTGLLGLATTDLSNIASGGFIYNVSGALLGPIFSFGKNKKRADIERRKTEEFLYKFEQTTLNAFKEVEDALISVKTLKSELKSVYEYRTAALNAENLSRQRYDKGITSYLEVLINQESSLRSQIQYSTTKQQLLNAYVSLYKSLGGGWLSEEEEETVKKQAEEDANNEQLQKKIKRRKEKEDKIREKRKKKEEKRLEKESNKKNKRKSTSK